MLFPNNVETLKYVRLDPNNSTVDIVPAPAGWTVPDAPETARFLIDIVSDVRWTKYEKKIVCFPAPDTTWSNRNRVRCENAWPSKRAHSALQFLRINETNLLYLHGGYRVDYPHPDSDDASIITMKYPRSKNFLDDMWLFNLDTGFWNQVSPSSESKPGPRMAHQIVHAKGNVPGDSEMQDFLLLFGGYTSNVFYQDFWEYNIKNNAWRQKKDFTIPLYPETCVEDGVGALDVWSKNSVADVEQYVCSLPCIFQSSRLHTHTHISGTQIDNVLHWQVRVQIRTTRFHLSRNIVCFQTYMRTRSTKRVFQRVFDRPSVRHFPRKRFSILRIFLGASHLPWEPIPLNGVTVTARLVTCGTIIIHVAEKRRTHRVLLHRLRVVR